jgi:SAM domain (Sterile alpha motif)/Adenylate and Guanylate cyclase catalytic domain
MIPRVISWISRKKSCFFTPPPKAQPAHPLLNLNRRRCTTLVIRLLNSFCPVQKLASINPREGAAMQQIADWLEKLGLAQYAQRFAENDIDLTILSDLTDQDLENIGVASLGHRRKLLRAFACLNDTSAVASPTQLAVSVPPPIAVASPPPAEPVGERRHVTVIFCDLADSTGISAKLDAEEWRDLVGAYLDAASSAVTEMGGKVAKKLGDGLMALFGYPVAQENDAERAVRAALSIQRSLAELNRSAVSGFDWTGMVVKAAPYDATVKEQRWRRRG